MFRWLTVFFAGLFLLALGFFLFAHHIVAFLPFSVEKQFVKPYEEMAHRWLGDHKGDPAVEAYLEELAGDLAEAMEVPEGIELSVHYLDNGEKNAFATLGGHVFVLRGLVESMPDENSLAMVLAHEISHVKNRDPVTAMGRGVVLQMAISYFSGGSTHGENLSSLGGQLGLLRYSRKQEERADLEALEALHRHYGHAGGYRNFFERILEQHGDAEDTPDWLQTHPDLAKRLDAMADVVEAQGYPVGTAEPLPEKIRQRMGERGIGL